MRAGIPRRKKSLGESGANQSALEDTASTSAGHRRDPVRIERRPVKILALQIYDRALYGSVVELQGFESIEEAMGLRDYRGTILMTLVIG
ncbi:hypothetical protein HPB47_005254 [Ixodes persulcatus]|uniref:Uncharacterized protein n=1 Tax=Ixodes persulcatus TaxID=34615 RepID=A0AC60PDG0_IXOPE|nr:hypothetical protein HPB47_005254 [Ixodes persulcatus]